MSFLLFNKKSNHGSKSIYSSQHTKLGIKKHFKRSKTLFMVISGILVIGGLFFTVKTIDSKLRSYFNPDDSIESTSTSNIVEKNIIFIAKDKLELSTSEKDYIKQKLSRSLSKKELVNTAQTIKVKLSLKQIHILKTASDSLTVSTEKLVPILSINLNKNAPFYITEDATIYQSKTSYDLPEVKDITFASKEIEEDGYLFLTEDEYLLISNVVKLYKELQSRNIDIDNIKYIKHRGLAFNIKDSKIDVIVGTNLFNEKLKKLENILKNKKNANTTTLVELDYNNKALITEKRTRIMSSRVVLLVYVCVFVSFFFFLSLL